jgi:hypothetical protein
MSWLKWIVAYLFDCTQATSCSEDFIREPWRIASVVSEFRELCLDKSRFDHKPGGNGMGWTQSRFTVSTAAQWSTPTPEKCD